MNADKLFVGKVLKLITFAISQLILSLFFRWKSKTFGDSFWDFIFITIFYLIIILVLIRNVIIVVISYLLVIFVIVLSFQTFMFIIIRIFLLTSMKVIQNVFYLRVYFIYCICSTIERFCNLFISIFLKICIFHPISIFIQITPFFYIFWKGHRGLSLICRVVNIFNII